MPAIFRLLLDRDTHGGLKVASVLPVTIVARQDDDISIIHYQSERCAHFATKAGVALLSLTIKC